MCEHGPKMNRLLAAIAFLLLPACVFAQSNMYSPWTNFPQDPNFFPLAQWLQGPLNPIGNGTVASAMKATKSNTLLAIDGGNNGGGWPNAFGVDCGANGICGQFAALVNNGIYVIPAVDQTSNTSAASIASVQAIASGLKASQHLIGYNLGDEPTCAVMGNFPTITSRVSGYDSTRPLFWNFTDWPFAHGGCYPPTNQTNASALQAISVGSFDVYPVTCPWCGNGGGTVPADLMWQNGWSVAQFRSFGRSGQPIWAYVDAGTDELSYSSQNGNTCSTSTNLCTPNNNEDRATLEQVNAEVWMSIINGAMGIEYFCQDSQGYSFCLGQGGSALANALASNLTYINTSVLSFAPKLNSPVLGICTMNNGTSYANFGTSCSNGILTMSTGASTVPGSAIVKNYNGTPYLFADSDRDGSATMTFTLSGYAGAIATVVYDSNAQYDAAHSSIGTSFTLDGSGKFSDTFGANGHNYQPKIYRITSGGPAAPSGLSATVQ